MIKYLKISFYLIFSIGLQASNDCEINIFDVGQGNCTLIKYNNEAIMIDAGSNELASSTLYNYKYEVNDKPKYLLLTSPSSPDNSDEEGSIDVTTLTGPSKSGPSKISYEDSVIENIRKGIPNMCLKTLVISHSDKDHYNWLPKIFTHLTLFKIETAVFGGFFADYMPGIQNWITSNSPSNINTVIFTGMYKGSMKKLPGNWMMRQGYARPYCSKLPNETPIEEKIEKSLRFKKNGNNELPFIEILSMNAGHALNPLTNEVYIINPDPNTNSIVLRVKHNGTSFLIPGDANEGTWNYIVSNYKGDLATNYILLSHHGSEKEECNSENILKLLRPKVCFISAGRRNGYNHPRGEVIDRVLKLESIDDVNDESGENFISYFRSNEEKIVYKRKKTNKSIFSTQDYGNINFNLKNPCRIVIARDRGSAGHLRFEKFKKLKGSPPSPRLDSWANDMIEKYVEIYQTYAFFLKVDTDGSNEKVLTPAFNGELKNKDFYILVDCTTKSVHKIKSI